MGTEGPPEAEWETECGDKGAEYPPEADEIIGDRFYDCCHVFLCYVLLYFHC